MSTRVLIAEDNADYAESLAILLNLYGFEVCVACDGRQAIEQFHIMEPQIALLDIGMPYISGHEVARVIRHTPCGNDVLLIAITGWEEPKDFAATSAAGFDHHLVKPLDPATLLKLMTE